MITIKSAGLKHGYSGYDHLIHGDECSNIVGRQFRSVAQARQAARSEVQCNADRRVTIAPIELEVLFSDGTTRWI